MGIQFDVHEKILPQCVWVHKPRKYLNLYVDIKQHIFNNKNLKQKIQKHFAYACPQLQENKCFYRL